MPIDWNEPQEVITPPAVQPPATPPVSATAQMLWDDPNNSSLMGGPTVTYGGFEDKTPHSLSLKDIFVGTNVEKYREKQLSSIEQARSGEIAVDPEPYLGGRTTGAPGAMVPGQAMDVLKGAARIPVGIAQFPGAVLQAIDDLSPGIVTRNGNPMGIAMLGLNNAAKKVDKVIEDIPSAGSALFEGVGSSAGFLGLGAGGMAAGLNPALTTAGAGAAVGGSSLYNEAGEMGATPEQAAIALAGGSLLGLTEAVEGRWFLDRANKATRGALMEYIKKNNYFSDVPDWVKGEALKGFIVEGLQEGGQTFGENLVARDIAGYDPTRTLNENVAASIISGGTVGSALGWGIGKLRRSNLQQLENEFQAAYSEKIAEGGINALQPGAPFTPLQDYVFLNQERQQIRQALSQAGEGPLNDFEAEYTTGDGTIEPGTLVAAKATGLDKGPLDISTPVGVPTRMLPQSQIPQLDEYDWETNPVMRDFFETTIADPVANPENTDASGSESIAYALRTSDVVFSEINPYIDQIEQHEKLISTIKPVIAGIKEKFATLPNAKEQLKHWETIVKREKAKVSELKTKSKLAREIASHVKDHVAALRTAFGEGTKFVVTDGSYLEESPLFKNEIARLGVKGAIHPTLNNIPLNDEGTETGRAALIFLRLDDMVTKLYEQKKLQKDMLSAMRQAGADKKTLKAQRQKMKEMPWYQNTAGRELFAAINHEVSHNLITRHLKQLIEKAKSGDRDSANTFFALMDEYEGWLKQMAGSPMTFFRDTVASEMHLKGTAGRAANEGASLAGHIYGSMVEPSQVIAAQEARNYARYIFNFDEFFADRTAKMIAALNSKIAPLIPETKFYKEVGDSIKSYFDALPDPIKNIYDSNWQDFLRAQGLGAKMEELQLQPPSTLLEILRGNQSAIGMEPGDFAGMQAAMDVWGWVQDLGQTLLQNAKDNPHVAPLQNYVGLTTDWAAWVRNMTAPTNEIIKHVNSLGKGSSAKVSEILFEEARDKKRLPAESVAARLDEQEFAVYQSIRQELDKVLAMMKQLTIADAQAVFAENPEQLQTRLDEIEEEFNKMQRQGYFPFMRFGRYTIFAKAKNNLEFAGEQYEPGDTITFQTFATEKERDKALQDVYAEIGKDAAISKGVMSDTDFAIQGMPRSMLLALKNSLKGEEATPEQIAVIDRAIEATTPFQSFKKQWVRKKGIHGYSEDMLRSFASYMRMAAGHMARVKYSPQLFGQVQQMDNDMQIMREVGEPTQKRQQMRDWMARHFSYIMNPSNEWTALRGAISAAYLGMNLKSAALQLVQIPQVVYPYLAARYGDISSVAALTKAPWTVRDYILNPMDFVPTATADVTRQLKGSKIVDEKGNPIPVYHGSLEQFDEFDPSKLGSNTGSPSAYEGFFFASNPMVANSYRSKSARKLREMLTTLATTKAFIKDVTGMDPSRFVNLLFRIQMMPQNVSPEEMALTQHPRFQEVSAAADAYFEAEKAMEDMGDEYFGNRDLTPDPDSILKEVYLNFKNPYIFNQKNADVRDLSYSEIIKKAKELGHDGVVIRNTRDSFIEDLDAEEGASDTDIYIAFQPEQIVQEGGKKATAPPNERQRIGLMLTQGLSEQWLDQSYATELALAASENNLDRGLALGSYLQSKSKRMWHNTTRFLMLPFHITEKANRYVTAVAAYKLEYEQSRDHARAVQAAREANWSANFEYARWNRPEFARGKKSVALMFSSFWQNSLYFATKDPGAMRYWLVMLYMAGLMGLPFAKDIEDLLSGILTVFKEKLGYKDPYVDLDMDAREFLRDLGAPEATADYLLHGVANDSFGAGLLDEIFGVPVPRFDVSGSVGMGDIVPGTELLSQQLARRGNPGAGGDLISGGVTAAAGAAGSLAEDLVNAAVSGNVADWKNAEKLIPFVFARNVSKAGRMLEQGVELTRAGEPIADFDTSNPRDIAEIIGQGLGFTPRETAKGWEAYMATKGLIRYYESQKRVLQAQLNQSFMQEDREARADMLNKIAEFNKNVPYPEFMIQDPGQGVEQYMQRQVEAGVMGISDKRYLRIKKQIDATFGTKTPVPALRTEDNQPISPL